MARSCGVKQFAQTRVGFVLDRKYEILKYIGHGGMSIVYLASDRRLNKTWAVKEFRQTGEQMKDETFRQSLIKEANLMKGLSHPALPRIVDIIEADGTIFIVMDFIDGVNLKSLMRQQGRPMDEKDVIDWGIQLCDVLEYLHTPDPKKDKPSIVYRDMKPENVMLRDDGSVCLIDLGIAKKFDETKSADTSIMGTREYAAPEQFDFSVQTDWRADIYSLGVTLHYLVTGQNPKKNIFKLQPIRVYNPQLDEGLEAVIGKCVQYNREDRYQSCREVAYDLEHHENLKKQYRDELQAKLNRFRALTIAAALSLAIGVAGMFLANLEKASTYESYMSEGANIALDVANANSGNAAYDSKVAAYRNAMMVDSARPEPYRELLGVYIEDGDFSSEEAADYYRAMDDYARRNCSEYASLCYDFANVYFTYTANYAQASTWFQNALDVGGLTSEQAANAETYIAICDFRKNLDSRDRLGNSGESGVFVQYWNSLGEACDRVENAVTTPRSKLRLYELVVDSCSSEAYTIPLMVGGVEREDLVNRLDAVKRQTEALGSQVASTIDRELYGYILGRLVEGAEAGGLAETAYAVVDRTYSSTFSTARGDSPSGRQSSSRAERAGE